MAKNHKDPPASPGFAAIRGGTYAAKLQEQLGGFFAGSAPFLVDLSQTSTEKQKNTPSICHFLPFLERKFAEGAFFKKFVQPTKSYTLVTFGWGEKHSFF